MSLRPKKDLVTQANLQSMRTSVLPGQDELRVSALICVYKNVPDPAEALNIMEMLGLIDGQGEFVAAGDMMSHTHNPHRRGIGNWIS